MIMSRRVKLAVPAACLIAWILLRDTGLPANAGMEMGTTSTTGQRDPLKQPFASDSIWNMPIGSDAIFVHAGLNPYPGGNRWASMPGIDQEILVLEPDAPLTEIRYSGAAWSGRDRCIPSGDVMGTVPLPADYIIAHSNKNSAAAFLLADGRTIVQAQPVARCQSGAAATAYVRFSNVDLYGPGTTGAHGGSGLSAIGGSLRLGELRPGARTGPRHALKVNVYAKEALYRCRARASCWRWPALAADSYALGWYGSATNNRNSAMRMGALLAIPGNIQIAELGLETEPARQLAWTLQNYGAYVVDDTYAAGFALNAETGPRGAKEDEFLRDWGFTMAQKVQDNTPWVRDIQRLLMALHVVDNNRPGNTGGGGKPRQDLAPPILAPESVEPNPISN